MSLKWWFWQRKKYVFSIWMKEAHGVEPAYARISQTHPPIQAARVVFGILNVETHKMRNWAHRNQIFHHTGTRRIRSLLQGGWDSMFFVSGGINFSVFWSWAWPRVIHGSNFCDLWDLKNFGPDCMGQDEIHTRMEVSCTNHFVHSRIPLLKILLNTVFSVNTTYWVQDNLIITVQYLEQRNSFRI